MLRTAVVPAPAGIHSPIQLHGAGISTGGDGPPDAGLPRITNTRTARSVPAVPAAAWSALVTAPAARTTRIPIPARANSEPGRSPIALAIPAAAKPLTTPSRNTDHIRQAWRADVVPVPN